MKIKDLLERSGVQSLSGGCGEEEITALTYDSRKAQTGSLFFCLRGARSNGEDFAPAAYAQGCRCFVSEGTLDVPEDADVVRVSDARQALAQISAAFFGFPQRDVTIIGVTGTKGKTTVAETACSVMNRMGLACGVIGSNGAAYAGKHVGTSNTTPESYELMRLFRAMRDEGVRYVVMEVSSHALALERVRGITFRVGAFTNLTRDHLDFHRTMEDYCDAKAQLFRQCEAAVCNGDDPWTPRLLRECACPVLRYGTGDSSRLRGENLRLTARSVAFDALLDGRRIPVTVSIPGRFTVYNALAALGICHMLGVPPEQGAAALQTASGIKGRMEVVPTPGLPCTVLIDYAHTPDALENVLTAVRGFAEGRVVAVFGCGGDRDREKRPQMGRIVSRLADVAVVTSDNPRWEQPEKIIEDILPGLTGPAESVVICDRREAIGWALKNSRPRDVIVLCGKGHETYQEVCGEKRHMDERELVAAYTNG